MGLLKIAIARGIQETDLIPAFQAVLDGGFDHLEITMNTANAENLIALASRKFEGKAVIGAGTVTTMDSLKKALKAGARYIVSPLISIPIIEFCHKKNIPVYPGALTPTEVFQAWSAGATMVKVFPISSVGGAPYIKELKGPFDHIKILACGGVTPENLGEYVDCGADAIAIGSQLFKKEWLEKKEYHKLTETAEQFG